MQRDLTLLREETEAAADIHGADASASDEQREFVRRWQDESLGQVQQDRKERKTYATRIFWLVCLWLAVIVALVVLQGFLGQGRWFSLSDSVLIAIATTTTASVTALLVVVVRYLFRTPNPPRRKAPPLRTMDR